MERFEEMIQQHRIAVARYIAFRLPSAADAEDVLQDTLLTAYRKQDQLKSDSSFKPWLLSIARSKCSDYFRSRAKRAEIPLAALTETMLTFGRMGPAEITLVDETLERLNRQDRQILDYYYFRQLPQAEIAKQLQIPLGTVKSRLHTARQNFKFHYPQPDMKGAQTMKQLPLSLPEYTIIASNEPPFPVVCEELAGWPLIPRLGEACVWGLYDLPSRRRSEYTEMQVLGKAEIHGIEGVEILALQHDCENYYRTSQEKLVERRFIAQLTDTHCRYLAETHEVNGIKKCFTFLDGESFMNNWGFGKDNCGMETHLAPRGLLQRRGSQITGVQQPEMLDVVGRYTVTLGGKTYDTICLMDICCYNDQVASEQFIDAQGKTVLWRRFNKNDWAYHRYQKTWSEMLPENERLLINGETFVHWYDCITDYIL